MSEELPDNVIPFPKNKVEEEVSDFPDPASILIPVLNIADAFFPFKETVKKELEKLTAEEKNVLNEFLNEMGF